MNITLDLARLGARCPALGVRVIGAMDLLNLTVIILNEANVLHDIGITESDLHPG